MYRRFPNRLLNAALAVSIPLAALLALLLVLTAPANDASAYHYHSPRMELGKMHSSASSRHEEFCVYTDGSITQANAYNRVAASLWIDGARDWDGLASNKVWFVPYSNPCPGLSNRSTIEIEYQVLSGGCGGVSCANLTNPYDGGYGHTDYNFAYVTLKTSHLTGGAALYHHVVNHETGHVLGFKDPNFQGDCVLSIMHSIYYGCTSNLEWPSDGDIWVGTTIANNTAP